MTSKRLFFNAIREDLRRRLWMIALSFVGNLLVQPVMCLMNWNALAEYRGRLETYGFSLEQQVQELLVMYGRDVMALSGLVAMAVAAVAGLSAFRFLFHKSSVDLYHSLPVRRSTLFIVRYLDGFLIWFVPFLACLGLSGAVMGSFFRESLGTAGAAWGLTKTAFSCVLVCTVDFLLVYNLVLAAVMLCGNALNALVSILVLGLGGISIWGVGHMFFEMYMDTFEPMAWEGWGAIYASPLASAAVLLFRAVDELRVMLRQGEVRNMLLINLGTAAFLGLCAWLLYRARPSEHAEQGIRNKAVSALFRGVCGVGAGMCGWLLFFLLSGNLSLIWGCFGAALGAVLAFGVLDIVFQMDFKAFFSHKLQMAAAAMLSLLLCFCFYQDWLGYDAYLPNKEVVEEISVFNINFANRQFQEEEFLDQVCLRDMEVAYPYLERVTAWQKWEGRDGVSYDTDTYMVWTRVKLKNGINYYRIYRVPEKDKETLLALLTTQEYMSQAYLLDESVAKEAAGKMTLSRGDSELVVGNADSETILSLIRAYNQDLLESPERAITGRGRLLVSVLLGTEDRTFLDVYDDMGRTVEALRQAGYGDWVRVEEASDIASIELGLFFNNKGYFLPQDAAGEDRVAAARLIYGIYGEETEEELRARFQEEAEYFYETWTGQPGTEILYEEAENGSLLITRPEEVEELLEWMEYQQPSRANELFRKEGVRVTVTARDGRVLAGYLRRGELPEKYIYRFGEL